MSNYIDMSTIEKEIEKNVSDPQNQFKALCQFIRTTEEYKECMYLYNFFVSEVANFIRNIGVEDSISAVIYLDLLLKNGMLSVTGQNKYHLYKNDRDFTSELFGARTLSGTSVCRHMSALTADILNFDYYASWLNSRYIENVEEISVDSEFLHAVVGFVCDSEKLIYDPTCSSFAALPDDPKYIEVSQNRVAKTFISYTSLVDIGDHILLNSKQSIVNPANEKELEIVWYTPFKQENLLEFINQANKINLLYKETSKEILNFRKNIMAIIKRIVELETKLHPRSDKKILKWELTQ